MEEADPAGGANPQNPGIDREPPRQQRGAEEREIDPAGWKLWLRNPEASVEEFIHEAKKILALEKEITGRVGKLLTETGYPVPNLEELQEVLCHSSSGQKYAKKTLRSMLSDVNCHGNQSRAFLKV